ncbi:hypothetical protein [Schaalia sp. lx-260]|uniref:hypothetical protein n=1 Tax=Schaalia sp. lx-260 TaxID=2899082 RepID=UPI001E3F2D4F|nr:hypothetical protein [Schaalia sp. lx-260]MCD4549681.1 hypothetical protein [Schaalia sp. lx-260]
MSTTRKNQQDKSPENTEAAERAEDTKTVSSSLVEVYSPAFPQLLVTSPKVEFVDGVALVSKTVAVKLEKSFASFGITRKKPTSVE